MSDYVLTRKRFLGTVGSGIGGFAASLAGCTTNTTDSTEITDETPENASSDNENNNESNDSAAEDQQPEEKEEEDENLDPPENGAIVFVYDDGPIEDYIKAFPAHQEFEAPATVGIVSNFVGRSDDWMNLEHLEALTTAGWEISSHTVQHTPLAAYELIEDAKPEDTAIHAEEYRHGHQKGLTVEITDGKHSVTREVAGLGGDSDDNLSVELEHPVKHSFSAGDAVIRYPADQMQEALRESQRDLEELGFEVNTLLAPYDDFDEWSMKFVPEYYDGVANARHGSRINDLEEFNPYATQRNYFIEFTSPEYVKQDLDEIADRGALGVLGAHTAKKEVTEERIRETLQWVNDRGIEVMTLREAIERFAH